MVRKQNPDDPPIHQNPTDPFSKLPAELKNMVIFHLSSRDIARLRLVSRSFRQLPQQLFLRLIKDEIPWFWEFDELKQMNDDRWREAYKDVEPRSEAHAKTIEKSREGKLTDQVNWLQIYKQLCILEKGVLGLRNRTRIWSLAEEVVRRVTELRQRLKDRDEDFPVRPTEEEMKAGLVKNSFYCPRCEFWQIERKASN